MKKNCASGWLFTKMNTCSLLRAHSSLQWPVVLTVTLLFPMIDRSCNPCFKKCDLKWLISWRDKVSVLNGLLSVHLVV